MPLDEDKYPEQTGRRRFVKGVVGSAALASVGAGTAASINTATSAPGAGGGTTEFVGIELISGPAPRGMPIVPIEITDEGVLQGKWPEVQEVDQGGKTVTVAQEDVGGVTYSSSWFQYCGVQQYSGTAPDIEANNEFLVKPGTYDWLGDLETGEPFTVDDFSDYEEWTNDYGSPGDGKPGMADWRSTADGRPMPVQVLRSPEVPKLANGEGKYSSLSADVLSFVDAATEESFIAWMDKCTHFCCVPGYRTSDFNNGGDKVYCQCHQSLYDPFSPVKEQFVALPRPK
jgi:Rieske Fe-S protein